MIGGKNRRLSTRKLDVMRATRGLGEFVGWMSECREKLLHLLGNTCWWSRGKNANRGRSWARICYHAKGKCDDGLPMAARRTVGRRHREAGGIRVQGTRSRACWCRRGRSLDFSSDKAG